MYQKEATYMYYQKKLFVVERVVQGVSSMAHEQKK